MRKRRRKPKALEIVLIMVVFGIAAVANSLSRPTVQQEVSDTLAAVKRQMAAMVSVYDQP